MDVDTKPETAFVAAALVLLVLPVLVMVGASALGIATRAGMLSDMHRMMNGDVATVWATLFIVWALIVTVMVLLMISQIIRRSRS